MDHLLTSLNALEESERKEFGRFLSLKKNKMERKDVSLLNDLLTGKAEKSSTKAEADRNNQNRKRIWNALADFIAFKEMQNENTPVAKMQSYISLAKFLFNNRIHKSGWKFLGKAEELAMESERFDMLKSIYMLKLENSHFEFAENISITMKKMEANNKLLDMDERILIATNVIRHKLEEIKKIPKKISFSDLIEETLTKFNLSYADFRNPKQILHLLAIIRSTHLASNNLHNFESFAASQYQRVLKAKGFDRYNHVYKLEMLYMLAHANFRNRNFKKALDYLEQLNENIQSGTEDFASRYLPKYIAMKSNIVCFNGENDLAIKLSQDLIANKKIKMSIKDSYNINLNLIVFYFYAGKFKLANRLFLFVPHTDEWLSKKMGVEWVIRKNLVYAILQYELGHEDICLAAIKKLEKKNADLFRMKEFERVKSYLALLRQYILDPHQFSKIQFYKDAETKLFTTAFDMEEYKTMAFYGWLKSKAEQQDFYGVMMELIRINSGAF